VVSRSARKKKSNKHSRYHKKSQIEVLGGFFLLPREKKTPYKSPTTATMTAAPARPEENLRVPAAAPVNGAEMVGFADELTEVMVLLVTVTPPVPLLIVSR